MTTYPPPSAGNVWVVRHDLPECRVDDFKTGAGIEFDNVNSVLEENAEKKGSSPPLSILASDCRLPTCFDCKEITGCARLVKLHQHRPIFDRITCGFIVRDIAFDKLGIPSKIFSGSVASTYSSIFLLTPLSTQRPSLSQTRVTCRSAG